MSESTGVPKHVLWDFPDCLGERAAVPVQFCQHCGFPIRVCGRLAPCQHLFCRDCALLHGQEGERCPRCEEPVHHVSLYVPDAP